MYFYYPVKYCVFSICHFIVSWRQNRLIYIIRLKHICKLSSHSVTTSTLVFVGDFRIFATRCNVVLPNTIKQWSVYNKITGYFQSVIQWGNLAYGLIAIHNILYEAFNIACVFFPIQSVQHPSGYVPKFTNWYHVAIWVNIVWLPNFTSIGIEVWRYCIGGFQCDQ